MQGVSIRKLLFCLNNLLWKREHFTLCLKSQQNIRKYVRFIVKNGTKNLSLQAQSPYVKEAKWY